MKMKRKREDSRKKGDGVSRLKSKTTFVEILGQMHKCVENMAGSSIYNPYLIIDDDDDDGVKFVEEPQLQEDSFCGICMDTKKASEMFKNTDICGHLYCSDCIRQHVAAKIQENQIKVTCPDPKCKVVIGPEACRSIVPKEVLERWENVLCESLINESDKFYCPFKDCSAMLVDDGGVDVTSSECPNCNRLFCAKCKVAWHSNMNCVEFKSLKKGEKNPDDKLINLAKKKKWKKCPKCNIFVEKVVGCKQMRCRCGQNFCYGCGKANAGDHRCPNCRI